MRGQLTLGNWKMNGSRNMLENFAHFCANSAIESDRLGIAIPSVYLNEAAALFARSNMLIGAQDVSEHDQGAYTGSIAARMLRELGCDFCLVGHSERRQYQHETSEQVAHKIEQLNTVAIRPVLCIGENLEQRGQGTTVETVISQVRPCLDALFQAQAPVIAYEPVWAIGTGRTASNEQAQEVHQAIRSYIADAKPSLASLPILYGGSVKPDNTEGLLVQEDIDGTLVGGASLEAASLFAIAKHGLGS